MEAQAIFIMRNKFQIIHLKFKAVYVKILGGEVTTKACDLAWLTLTRNPGKYGKIIKKQFQIKWSIVPQSSYHLGKTEPFKKKPMGKKYIYHTGAEASHGFLAYHRFWRSFLLWSSISSDWAVVWAHYIEIGKCSKKYTDKFSALLLELLAAGDRLIWTAMGIAGMGRDQVLYFLSENNLNISSEARTEGDDDPRYEVFLCLEKTGFSRREVPDISLRTQAPPSQFRRRRRFCQLPKGAFSRPQSENIDL